MMISFNEIKRLSNVIRGACSYINNVNRRKHWPISIQVCNFTKDIEESVSIEKPKRPLTPFFKLMMEMRPVLQAKHPEKSYREIMKSISDHYKNELDPEIKSQMQNEYMKSLKDYSVLYKIYKDSLAQIKKDDRMGRPKKPVNTYLLFLSTQMQTGIPKKEFLQKVKINWENLPDCERSKFRAQYKENVAKYQKELQAWELKMQLEGRLDIINNKK